MRLPQSGRRTAKLAGRRADVERRRLPDRLAPGYRQSDVAELREPGADARDEVFGRRDRSLKGGAQDLPRFLLHRVIPGRGTDAQAALQRLVEIAYRQGRHVRFLRLFLVQSL